MSDLWSSVSGVESVAVTWGGCPGCVPDIGDFPRSFYEAVRAQRAETDRCPSASVGCPDTPPALKREAWVKRTTHS